MYFLIFLSFEKRFSPQQAMIWTQENFLRIIGFIADNLSNFPPASDLFLKKAPSRKITNNLGIYTHLGGNMSGEGTARGKINIFLKLLDVLSFKKKRGIHASTSWENTDFFSKTCS